MQPQNALTILCGIVAGALPLFPGAGLLFSIWAAYLPLLFLGLSQGTRHTVNAGAIAVVVAYVLGGGPPALNMGMMVMFPSCLLVSLLLRHKRDANGRIVWYPPIRALCDITLLPAALFMMLTLISGLVDKTSKQGLVSSLFKPDLAAFDPQSAAFLTTVINDYSYVLVGLAGWLWILTLWLLAYLSHRMLAAKGLALRPDISLLHKGMPNWLPVLLMIAIALSAFGGENDALAGKCVGIILSLPYLVNGMAVIHRIAAHWTPKYLWLSMIYIILICQFWTVIIVSIAGLYFHLSEMLDKRQKIG